MIGMISVIIVYIQAIFRAGVAKVLEAEADLCIVGQPQFLQAEANVLKTFRVPY